MNCSLIRTLRLTLGLGSAVSVHSNEKHGRKAESKRASEREKSEAS